MRSSFNSADIIQKLKPKVLVYYEASIIRDHHQSHQWGRRDRMVLGFTTIYVLSAYHL